jgi:hypothetical protein
VQILWLQKCGRKVCVAACRVNIYSTFACRHEISTQI